MIVCASDRYDAVAVCGLRNDGKNAESVRDDFAGMLAAFRRQDEDCRAHPGGPVFVLFVAGDVPVPDARSRKELAAAASGLGSSRHCFVLVSTSSLVRGVLRAVTWLAPPKKGHHVATVDRLAEAYLEAERVRGQRLLALRELGARVEREVG